MEKPRHKAEFSRSGVDLDDGDPLATVENDLIGRKRRRICGPKVTKVA